MKEIKRDNRDFMRKEKENKGILTVEEERKNRREGELREIKEIIV